MITMTEDGREGNSELDYNVNRLDDSKKRMDLGFRFYCEIVFYCRVTRLPTTNRCKTCDNNKHSLQTLYY